MPPHRLTMLGVLPGLQALLEGKAVEVDEIQPAAKAYPIIGGASRGCRTRQRIAGLNRFERDTGFQPVDGLEARVTM